MTHTQPLANGLRTDHPVPGLPFVDDSHIPLDEGPEAIEAVGRNKADGMWGRYDPDRRTGGWLAFTTDPLNHSLGWSVRFHPEHGRTVLLMRDDDTSSLHSAWDGERLLFRAGGYWWNGTTWYRPGQVWDPVAQDYEKRKARAAITVSAADMLDGRADAAKAYVGKVLTFDAEAPAPENWSDHLALWAARHQERDSALPLEKCVVDVATPELSGAQLLGVPEMAELGGITASTLRAYISRGNSEVPQPQATVGGRDQWARAVADDWVEARQRSREGVRATMSADDRHKLSKGAAEVRDRFAADFHNTLWDRPDVRKRWILRARNEDSVREVADALAWSVATSLDRILPTHLLGHTIQSAVLDSFADAVQMDRDDKKRGKTPREKKVWMLYVSRPVAEMLDWFIRHHPESAHHYIGDIMHEAHRRWEIPAEETIRTLRTAVSMDGKMSDEDRKTFFALLTPPTQDN
ncbi:MerR family transcriptional regulator [Streptomyces sp. NPDC055607]